MMFGGRAQCVMNASPDAAVPLHSGCLYEAFMECSSVPGSLLKALYEHSHSFLARTYEGIIHSP